MLLLRTLYSRNPQKYSKFLSKIHTKIVLRVIDNNNNNG